jgi:hypothetical protein
VICGPVYGAKSAALLPLLPLPHSYASSRTQSATSVTKTE